MKLATQQEIDEHNSATIRGALEGALGSAAVAVPGFYMLNRRWAYYRSLPLSLKTLGVIIIVAPCLSIQAERRGLEYDKSRWTGAGKEELDREAAVQERQWQGLSTGSKIRQWATDHQYSMILSGWAASMAGVGAYLYRDRYQTTGQKLVQARVWAQGITIGLIIAAGILTQTNRAEAAKHKLEDHSWKYILEEQAKEDAAQKAAAGAAPA